MTKLLNYLWRIWFLLIVLVATILCGIFVYPLSFSSKTFRACYFFMRIWCFILFYGMGFRYELSSPTGKSIDPEQKYVFISNHTSIMDIMLMCILHRKHPICFVGKKELVKIPIFGTIYKRVCVMVDRKNMRSRMDVYRRCAERMKHGQNIVIYPEGGVPDDTSIILDEFKDGAFTLSSKHHFPIAVYTFIGLKEMFPFDSGKGHPGKVKVILNDILQPNENKDEMKKNAFELVYKSICINK
ncbi:1-acyl-sn-glycerol-3-phosphate acyltransferase [Elizabethkingia meningoseptica]|nr:lysophospholipid acyltransferase family protein [Elizabethkingia meningoseptica]MCL1676573.1 1-acyl-sn-glycerol-3-phosphate acyltransferase [Elizabethkingia meningoseptica]MCL1687363.1 1-acyl-sn-glycerol-3-phosphate acyltransferase [Elizabethkingia meningoseptica]OPB93706.1 glycerol acyltransferase [Elizabethkingia meningoseptica]